MTNDPRETARKRMADKAARERGDKLKDAVTKGAATAVVGTIGAAAIGTVGAPVVLGAAAVAGTAVAAHHVAKKHPVTTEALGAAATGNPIPLIALANGAENPFEPLMLADGRTVWL